MLKKKGKNDCKRFQKTEKNTSFLAGNLASSEVF